MILGRNRGLTAAVAVGLVVGIAMLGALLGMPSAARADADEAWQPVQRLLDPSVAAGSEDALRQSGERRQALILGADERTAVQDTTIAPWRLIANLYLVEPGPELVGSCTGTMIGDNLVLTAAHCVWDPEAGAPTSSAIVVATGDTTDVFPFGTAVVRSVSYPRGWVETGESLYDIALLHLEGSDPFGGRLRPYVPLAAVADWYFDLPNLLVTTTGFPGDKPFGSMWFSRARDWYVDADFVYTDTDTTPGHSGASLMSAHEAREEVFILAVHAGGQTSGRFGRNVALRLTQTRLNALATYCASKSCTVPTATPAPLTFRTPTPATATPSATPVATTAAIYYGRNLQSGDAVEAFIGGRSCGRVGVNGRGEWVIQIPVNAPCSPVAGAPVTFTVNGRPAVASPAVTWQLGGTPSDVTNGIRLTVGTTAGAPPGGAGAVAGDVAGAQQGFGLLIDADGGPIDALVDAVCTSRARSRFDFTRGGGFVSYIPGAQVAAVNAQFLAAFPGGVLPSNTAAVAQCNARS